ncbi:GNAT family N-acetyltransferase [Enterococcus hulanensis]|uniref:GNAT family N-acetyltransferase n=1 Tax=Enterococcus hulanensis TaxID=2559929 RepID=UPI0010F663CD|nr:GNAT family N-acetyltransferase [Enterococcus hulanensis]
MEIRQSERTALMPFLDEVFEQQHKTQFSDNMLDADEKTLAYGAWIDEQLAGAVVGKKQYDTLHISLLGVGDEYKKLGVGSKLMQAIEEQALQEKVKTITLTTKAYQALGFYLKHGYEVFGELEDVPMVGTTKYYLVKRISR